MLLWAGLGTWTVPGTPSPALPRVAAVLVMLSHGGASQCFQMASTTAHHQGYPGQNTAPSAAWPGASPPSDHLPLLSFCPSAGAGCASLPLASTAGMLPSASGLLPYLQVPFSALQRSFLALGQFLHGTVVHRWLSQHCSPAVMFTSVYLSVSFHESYTVCIPGTGHLAQVNFAVYHCLLWLSLIYQSKTY